MANVSGDGLVTSKLFQTLSASQAGIANFFSALNIFLSITASLGSALILVALHKVSSIHPPTKLFFRCLGVTDLCVGLIAQPLFATLMLSLLTKTNVSVLYYVNQVCWVSSWILCGVSVLMTTAISVDSLLALFLEIRYRHVVTLRRVRVGIACLWLKSVSTGSIWMWRRDVTFKLISVCLAVSLVTSIFCHTGIHLKHFHFIFSFYLFIPFQSNKDT